jgi:hypothetical protein
MSSNFQNFWYLGRRYLTIECLTKAHAGECGGRPRPCFIALLGRGRALAIFQRKALENGDQISRVFTRVRAKYGNLKRAEAEIRRNTTALSGLTL